MSVKVNIFRKHNPMKLQIEQNYNLKHLNTFKLDVRAKFFCTLENTEHIREALEFSNNQKTSYLVLSGGSNILFTHNPQMLVMANRIKGLEKIDENNREVIVQAGSGIIWDDFVKWTVDNNLYGAVNLSFIPGLVGAAPIQNIGAYGSEAKDIILGVKYIDTNTGEQKTLSNNECRFSYRNSIFKQELKGKAIITSVVFKLSKEEYYNLNYKALSDAFSNQAPDLKKLRETIGKIRSEKLPSPDKIGNAGSFFKNPVVDSTVLERLKTKFENIPHYPVEDNKVKLAAGWLIEKAGFKGVRRGNAGVYEKNALVLVNYGNATGGEILSLAREIQDKVEDMFGVRLEPEVNIL